MSKMCWLFLGAAYAASSAATLAFADTEDSASDDLVERGRYLVQVAGCNDCHTPGYAFTGGNVPEDQWLVGDRIGWRGAWGTTYPINLRLFMQGISEQEWLAFAKSQESRPPMPWFALHDMTPADLAAIYRFVRHLGPAGSPAPQFVPPDREPEGPFVLFPPRPPETASR